MRRLASAVESDSYALSLQPAISSLQNSSHVMCNAGGIQEIYSAAEFSNRKEHGKLPSRPCHLRRLLNSLFGLPCRRY
jgi:hypothetical protein